jgi:hypothetical protein
MPAATYGAYNPNAVDPWPIEGELAKMAATSPAMAQMMLGNYQEQRQAASNVYGEEAERQHDFAKQQLANQLYEARMKLVPELAKTPGGAGLLASDPTIAGSLGTPDAWQGLVTAQDEANRGLNIKNVGQGMQGMSNSGTAFNNTSQLMPSLNIPVGENVQVQRARIDAAAKVQAAAMHGAKGGGGSAEPRETVQIARSDFLRSRGVVPTDAQPSAQPLPGAAPTGGASSSSPPTSRTNLPSARQGQSPMARPPSNTSAGVTAAQQHVLANEATVLSKATPAQRQAYTEAKAANGGKPNVVITPQGPQLVDKAGRPL